MSCLSRYRFNSDLTPVAHSENSRGHLAWSWRRILALELGVPVRLVVQEATHFASLSSPVRFYCAWVGTFRLDAHLLVGRVADRLHFLRTAHRSTLDDCRCVAHEFFHSGSASVRR